MDNDYLLSDMNKVTYKAIYKGDCCGVHLTIPMPLGMSLEDIGKWLSQNNDDHIISEIQWATD